MIATTASYFEGNSVTQFSTTIGFYMAFMGVGSFISRYFTKRLIVKFIFVELLLSFWGGISIPSLYLIFAHTEAFSYYKFLFISIIAVLIGLEIPLLLRLMKQHYSLKVNISNILSLDYLGALVATLLFPLFLFPFFGTFKTSLFFGLVNIGLVFINLLVFRPEINRINKKIFHLLLNGAFITVIFLTVSIFFTNTIMHSWYNQTYTDRVIYMKRSPYQNIILTKYRNDLRMYLNGSLQFSSIDEYRYHESLVHIPMELLNTKKNILVLGGGDGLAVRELLKYKDVENIHLVDLDEKVIQLSRNHDTIKKLNKSSLLSDKLTIHILDAFTFLRKSQLKFDLIIADLPDPSNISLAKLYTLGFYSLVRKHLQPDGIFVTQATSPFHAKNSFWCIQKTIAKTSLKTYPYHLNVPSFAEWGFIMASSKSLNISSLEITRQTKFLNTSTARSLFIFGKDIQGSCQEASAFDRPVVLTSYQDEWQYD